MASLCKNLQRQKIRSMLDLTPGKPSTLSTWRPAQQHVPETRESFPEPISDQLPKTISVSLILSSMSPNSRRQRPWKEN